MWLQPNPYLINIVAIWMVVEVLNQEFAQGYAHAACLFCAPTSAWITSRCSAAGNCWRNDDKKKSNLWGLLFLLSLLNVDFYSILYHQSCQHEAEDSGDVNEPTLPTPKRITRFSAMRLIASSPNSSSDLWNISSSIAMNYLNVSIVNFGANLAIIP